MKIKIIIAIFHFLLSGFNLTMAIIPGSLPTWLRVVSVGVFLVGFAVAIIIIVEKMIDSYWNPAEAEPIKCIGKVRFPEEEKV